MAEQTGGGRRAALKATPLRVAVMRRIAAGEVESSRDGSGRLTVWMDGGWSDGRTRNVVLDFHRFGLAVTVPLFEYNVKPVKITGAGRRWLADVDAKEKQS